MPAPAPQSQIEQFMTAVLLRRLEECRQLLQGLEAAAQHDHDLRLWCRYLRGILSFEEANDWAEAERIFAALLDQVLTSELRGKVLYALGRTYDVQARWQEAIATFEQARTHAEAHGLVVEAAKAWKHVAICYENGFVQGEYAVAELQQALLCAERALALIEPFLHDDPADDLLWLAGSVWNELGSLNMYLGRLEEALACYQRDLSFCRQLEDWHGVGISLLNSGEIHQKLGAAHSAEARTAYEQALALFRTYENKALMADALADLALLEAEMGNSVTALGHLHEAIDLAESLRAGISSESGRAGFFSTLADVYAHAVLLALALDRPVDAFNLVERARARAFLDTLAAGTLDVPRAAEARPTTLVEVQAVLPDHSLLLVLFTTGLEEVRLGRNAQRQNIRRHRFPPAKTILFAATRSQLRVHQAPISPNALQPNSLESVAERHFLDPALLRQLYDTLILPIDDLLSNRRRLYIVPHGPYHYLPFQALLGPEGEPLLRRGGPELVYGPSVTILARPPETQSALPARPCLALGYNGAADDELLLAEAEAVRVAQLTGGDAWVASDPKRTALAEQAPGHRLLHFSCHGRFDPAAPLESWLQIGPGETLRAADILQGLALNSDLVVLSACESGLSRVRRGDELIGLLRALRYAGARRVISTLWRVNEVATLLVMEKFYTLIGAGVDMAGALTEAQLHLRALTGEQVRQQLADLMAHLGDQPGAEPWRWAAAAHHLGDDTSHPFADPIYWAPFVLFGSLP
jgi:CHAT domain-containing protein